MYMSLTLDMWQHFRLWRVTNFRSIQEFTPHKIILDTDMASYLDVLYKHNLHNVELSYLMARVKDILFVMYIIIDMIPL